MIIEELSTTQEKKNEVKVVFFFFGFVLFLLKHPNSKRTNRVTLKFQQNN